MASLRLVHEFVIRYFTESESVVFFDGCFVFFFKQSSVEIKISMESEGSQTNGSAIDWYKNLTSCGKLSEEKIKAESVAFFMLSPEEEPKTKRCSKFALRSW